MMLESLIPFNFLNLTGSAKITNVQFIRTGQKGWTDKKDPRYSVVFKETNDASGRYQFLAKGSYVSYIRGCSFHDSFNTAIGLYAANRMVVRDNVIHRVVGSGKARRNNII